MVLNLANLSRHWRCVSSTEVWISLSSSLLWLLLWKDTKVYLTLLLCWQVTKCLKREEKKNFCLNLRKLIVHSELACSLWSQPFAYIQDVIHQLLRNWDFSPFSSGPLCSGDCISWKIRMSARILLKMALQPQNFQFIRLCSPILSYIMQLHLCVQCLCVKRPSGILKKIGKAVCSANFMV